MFDRSIRIEFDNVDIRPIEKLRVAFEIDKNDGLQFNHGAITIYNLSLTTRSKIARPHPLGFPLVDPVIKIRLYAGYAGEEVLLISGDILTAVNEKRGADWLTVIEIYSGLEDSTKADVEASFATATNAKTICDKLLSRLGIDIKYTQEAIESLNNKKVSDFSTYGLAATEASRFLQRYDLAFTIEEGGQGLVYKEDRPRNPDASKTKENTFSPQSGLVGTPKITRSGIELKTLLRPKLKLFDRIFVESETTRGTLGASPDYSPDYHIIGIKHLGDNRGNDWFTELECSYSKISDGVY